MCEFCNQFPIEIKSFLPGQENEISAFIKNVYDEFVATDYTPEGNSFFYEWIKPEKILARQLVKNSIFIAYNAGAICGMIETRANNRISLLFVAGNMQRKGIARRLFLKSLSELLKLVHASPFSIPVYEKLGFKATDVLQENLGIKYLPMELVLKK